MIKKLLILLILLLTLSACFNHENDYEIKGLKSFQSSKQNTIPNKFDNGKINIEMSLKNGVYDVKAKELKLHYTNKGESLFYGAPYEIEAFTKGTWQKVPFKEGTAFIEIAYILNKNSEVTDQIRLDTLKSSLKPGYYRIVKEFYGSNNKKIKLAAIFQLKKRSR